MTPDCGASLHFDDSHLIGEIDLQMKDTKKLDPSETIVVASRSKLSGVSMGILTIRFTDTQGFLHDMLLPAIIVPRLAHYLLSGGTAALKQVNTVNTKESYLDVGQFKISRRKDTD